MSTSPKVDRGTVGRRVAARPPNGAPHPRAAARAALAMLQEDTL